MGGQRGPEQPQFLHPLPRASEKTASLSPGHRSILRPLILADVAAEPQLLSSRGMLPIFLWLHKLMNSSKRIKLPLAEATQRKLLEFFGSSRAGWEGLGTIMPGKASGNLAAARPCVVGACVTFPGLGCTGPPPWMLLEMESKHKQFSKEFRELEQEGCCWEMQSWVLSNLGAAVALKIIGSSGLC